MRVFGKPEYLYLYQKHFASFLAKLDTATWDLDLYFLSQHEMPQTSLNSRRPHFQPPSTARIPIADVSGISVGIFFSSQIFTIAHEIGHYIHTAFMGADGGEKWQEYARLTGRKLVFNWVTIDFSDYRRDYPHIPSYENFADDFAGWLLGNKTGSEYKKFYYSLWGQAYMAEATVDIGSKDVYLDGKKVAEMDIPARIENGRTILELRGIGQVLGARLDWKPKEGKAGRVYIYR